MNRLILYRICCKPAWYNFELLAFIEFSVSRSYAGYSRLFPGFLFFLEGKGNIEGLHGFGNNADIRA
jgi:hypothetical protein